MAKCEVCAIPYGETVCVTCGAKTTYHCPHCHVEGEQEHGVDCPLYGVEVGTVNLVYEVGGTALVPGMSSIKPMTVREGVQVEPAPCGKCGRMTVSRIESPDGQVGCLDCLKDFLLGEPSKLG